MNVIDFFCGAGGASCGLQHSEHARVVAAVNHDPQAIACHAENHPEARHYNADIKRLDPEVLARNHPEADAFWFSAECTSMSSAKGGQPRDPDSRMLNFELPRYARALKPRYVFIENVPDILHWGPLKDGRVDPDRKGELHRLWIKSMERLGYRYDYRILDSADYGAHTSRPRYYGVFALGDLPIRWPEPTHRDPRVPASLYNAALEPWRTAREILDLGDHGKSILRRKKPLAPATIRRILHGINRYAPAGERGDLEQFLVKYYGQGTARPLGEPLDAITTKDRFALVTVQFVKRYYSGDDQHNSLDEPPGTIATIPHQALVTAGVLESGVRDVKLRMLSVDELRRAKASRTGNGYCRARRWRRSSSAIASCRSWPRRSCARRPASSTAGRCRYRLASRTATRRLPEEVSGNGSPKRWCSLSL